MPSICQLDTVYSLSANWLRNYCTQTCLKHGLSLYSILFLVYSLFFQSGISNSISKIISLSLSFLISLCYPLKPFFISFLSQERHNFRRALWNWKSMDCSLPSTQGRWTSSLSMPKLVPNLHISESSSSVHGWQQLKTCPAPSRSLNHLFAEWRKHSNQIIGTERGRNCREWEKKGQLDHRRVTGFVESWHLNY